MYERHEKIHIVGVQEAMSKEKGTIPGDDGFRIVPDNDAMLSDVELWVSVELQFENSGKT